MLEIQRLIEAFDKGPSKIMGTGGGYGKYLPSSFIFRKSLATFYYFQREKTFLFSSKKS